MPKALTPARFPVPGTWGLNSQRKADILQPQWATVAKNCVFDDSNRLASRQGYQYINQTPVTGNAEPRVIFEYNDGVSGRIVITAVDNKIYRIDGNSLTDISGTITTPTGDNWKFQNFNGKCVGFQEGHPPIVIDTVAGAFYDILLTGVETPTQAANTCLAAFGRVWAIDGTQLRYTNSLDETTWTGALDLSTVWLSGMDRGTALAEFNGNLIVFGEHSIVVYTNPWVPTGGGSIDEATIELTENIGNIGCIARDSVQYIGTDIVFLSAQGLRSLGRTIQEKSMPVRDISKNVNEDLLRLVGNDVTQNIKSAYSKKEGFYVLTLPASNITYYFDLRYPLPDGSFRVTDWSLHFSALLVTEEDDEFLLAIPGYIARYNGYLDGVQFDGTGGTAYQMEYTSGWNDLGENEPSLATLNKYPKKGDFLILGGSGQVATLKWAFDFIDTFFSYSTTIPISGVAEWNIAEYGIGEYSGGLIYKRVKAPLKNSGQVIKFGFQINVAGRATALQLLDMHLLLGRTAT